jgi:tRNA dimethylallyltransferase
VPIVVGGTCYWIQHLLFPDRLVTASSSSSSAQPVAFSQPIQRCLADLSPDLTRLFNSLPVHPPDAAADPAAAFQLHSLLAALDPAVASRWHWKDTRKVLRSISIVKQTGKPPSDIFLSQSSSDSAPRSVPSPPSPVFLPLSQCSYHTLCFWLHVQSDVLHRRLDERVDNMIKVQFTVSNLPYPY